MLEMEDLEEEEERKSNQKMSESDENEEVLQVGGDHESGEEVPAAASKAELIGAKRRRDEGELGDEEEDMDFEAIDNETKKFKM